MLETGALNKIPNDKKAKTKNQVHQVYILYILALFDVIMLSSSLRE